jgi:GT2 family glycosyltransferase
VLVCTRGRGALVRECLAAVKAALGPADELLVVEAETAEAQSLVERLKDDRCGWLSAPSPGKSRQLNYGIRAARGELVLITDDDCVVPPDWIDAMAAPFAEPDVGIAFGPVDGLTQLPGSAPVRLRSGPAPAHAWAFSHGAAMAVRRAAAFDVGGFDERIGPGTPVHGEEADLLLRMESAGWQCWVLDSPPVRHLEWRTEEQDRHNLLVYERGGGAWVGAAVRRDPRGAAGAIVARLRYQAGHFRGSELKFALASQASFAAGLAAGLRLAPARFLDAGADAERPPGRDPRKLPWPALHGRSCLVISAAGTIAAELRLRGAIEVVELAPPTPPGREFDVIVAERLFDATDDPLAAFRALAPSCREALLSIERIDLLRSVTARGRPRDRGALNGAAHRQLLEDAGFEPRLASRPWRAANGLQRAVLAYPAA